MGFFSNRVFGRKGVPDAPPRSTFASAPRAISYETIAAACDAKVRPDDPNPHAWAQTFNAMIEPLTPLERGDLYVSLVPWADALAEKRVHAQESVAVSRMHLCATKCRERPLEVRPERLRDFVTLIVATRESQYTKSQYSAKRIVDQIRAALDAGGYLTSRENDLLATYARAVRDDARYSKGDRRRTEQLAAVIEKIAGIETSATSILLERCDDADSGLGFGPRPPLLDFTVTLMAQVATELAAIEADLRASGKPGWMKSEGAFDARFPRNGVVDARFGQWRDEGLVLPRVEMQEMPYGASADVRDFAQFRVFLKDRSRKLATPAIYTDACAAYETHDVMIRHNWSGKALPELDRLADLADPQQTQFVEQLVTAKMGTRPPAQWLKATLKLVEAMGAAETQARILDWLTLFHTPCPTREAIYQAFNHATLQHLAERIAGQHPDWPSAIDAAGLPAVAANIALNVASSHIAALPFGLTTFTVSKCHEWTGFAFNPFTWDAEYQHRLSRQSNVFRNQSLSVENEQVVRALLWLLPHLPDTARAVDALEKSVPAGIALKQHEYRALTATNAALAGLETIGAPAEHALLRLSQRVEQAKVLQNVQEILARR